MAEEVDQAQEEKGVVIQEGNMGRDLEEEMVSVKAKRNVRNVLIGGGEGNGEKYSKHEEGVQIEVRFDGEKQREWEYDEK